MAKQYTTYTTIEGERWDSIAYKAYGDPMRLLEIAEANPGVALVDRLPGGLKLLIPVDEAAEAESIDQELLPPWKR